MVYWGDSSLKISENSCKITIRSIFPKFFRWFFLLNTKSDWQHNLQVIEKPNKNDFFSTNLLPIENIHTEDPISHCSNLIGKLNKSSIIQINLNKIHLNCNIFNGLSSIQIILFCFSKFIEKYLYLYKCCFLPPRTNVAHKYTKNNRKLFHILKYL